MHPWKTDSYVERKARHREFRQWLRDNPDKRLHAGQVREDGKVFLGYGYGYHNGEHWADADNYARRNEHSRLKLRRLRKNPEYVKKWKDYIKYLYKNREARFLARAERARLHRIEKPWMSAARTRRRYALKRARIHPDLDRAAEAALFKEARRLSVETGQPHHVDHIIPLKFGGWHHHKNMQVLPESVNLTKSFDPFWFNPDYKTWQDVPATLWPFELYVEYLRRLPISA